ncbi:MAG: 2-C-methyl-D-erythritol 2,4-cyclodiphosphate synthase [Phycisphaerales bacterium]|nr:2-C-methyl-D-erythritol 2,4-cyclodiphosphate synthase [Phycisphaerales bacterium]
MADYRVGIGYDLHQLVAGRKLVLGGVTVPYDRGLSGHSDADVLLHAVTDALLGACALPDIGELFPDTDPAYAGADSAKLLLAAMTRVRDAGFQPHNVDCVIHAEQPKLSAYKRPIAERIAELLGLAADRVSVKAKTNEGVGPVGTGEAIAATVVVMVRLEA